MTEYFDEEGLLKVIKTCELSDKIAKLAWNWDDHFEPIKKAYDLMDRHQKLFIEISEYMQRMGTRLSKYQRNQINNTVEDLEKIIPFMKNKIKDYNNLENQQIIV